MCFNCDMESRRLAKKHKLFGKYLEVERNDVQEGCAEKLQIIQTKASMTSEQSIYRNPEEFVCDRWSRKFRRITDFSH